jgi:hypothetical protein
VTALEPDSSPFHTSHLAERVNDLHQVRLGCPVQRNAAFFADPDKTNKRIKLFWIGVGKDDRVVTETAHNTLLASTNCETSLK